MAEAPWSCNSKGLRLCGYQWTPSIRPPFGMIIICDAFKNVNRSLAVADAPGRIRGLHAVLTGRSGDRPLRNNTSVVHRRGRCPHRPARENLRCTAAPGRIRETFPILLLPYSTDLIIIHLLPTPRSEGGEGHMTILTSFILSVLASVVAYYICKWLDGE